MRKIIIILFLSIVCFASELTVELPGVIPDEPNLYIAAVDFLDIVDRQEHKALIGYFGDTDFWSNSRRTRQLMKLSMKIDDLSHFIGAEFTRENLRKIMRGPSAMAFYGVGDVEFVFVSMIDAVPLWIDKSRFETEIYEGYELASKRSESEVETAFCLADGYFIAGNRIDLVKSAIDHLDNKTGSLAKNSQFADLLPDLPADLELIAYLNMDSLTADQYWQRYWFQTDQSGQKSIGGAVWAYQFTRTQAIETRIISHENGITGLFEEKPGSSPAKLFPANTLIYHEITAAKEGSFDELTSYFQPFISLNMKSPEDWSGEGCWGLLRFDMGMIRFIPVTILKTDNPGNTIRDWTSDAASSFNEILEYGNAPDIEPEISRHEGVEVISFIPIPLTEIGLSFAAIDDYLLISPSRMGITKCLDAINGNNLASTTQFKTTCPNNGQIKSFANMDIISTDWNNHFEFLVDIPGWDSWWARSSTEDDVPSISEILNNFEAIGSIEKVTSGRTITKRTYIFED